MFLATTTVEDFDRFNSIFSTTSAEKRNQHGSKGALVFRDPNQEDRGSVPKRLRCETSVCDQGSLGAR